MSNLLDTLVQIVLQALSVIITLLIFVPAGAFLAVKLEEVENSPFARIWLGLSLIAILGVFHWYLLRQADWSIFLSLCVSAGFAVWEIHDFVICRRLEKRWKQQKQQLSVNKGIYN